MMSEYTWRPRGGLLAQYAEVFGPTTDAPQQFHTFVCFTVMASTVARKVWIRDGAQQLFLNLFVLLLAPSSLYRKSTCVGHGTDLIRALEDPMPNGDRVGRILYPQQFTPESFLEILQAQPSGLISIDEFRSFLDGMRRDYNAGMRELFMTLYDCRGLHRKATARWFLGRGRLGFGSPGLTIYQYEVTAPQSGRDRLHSRPRTAREHRGRHAWSHWDW